MNSHQKMAPWPQLSPLDKLSCWLTCHRAIDIEISNGSLPQQLSLVLHKLCRANQAILFSVPATQHQGTTRSPIICSECVCVCVRKSGIFACIILDVHVYECVSMYVCICIIVISDSNSELATKHTFHELYATHACAMSVVTYMYVDTHIHLTNFPEFR